jgi:hypothetical protein
MVCQKNQKFDYNLIYDDNIFTKIIKSIYEVILIFYFFTLLVI